MRGVYVGLGANVGDRAGNLFRTRRSLAALPGTTLLASSRLYETEPVGVRDQPWFLNQVVELETDLPPADFLEALLKIETLLGRVRTVRWGPRPVDLDLLLYGSLTLSTLALTLPHPRLAERGFVVLPLLDLAPGLVLPGGVRLATVAAALAGGPEVRRWEPVLLGAPCLHFAALDSTNAELHRLAAAGATEGTAVVAGTQSAGRGRLGRSWVSPPELGLYLSTLVRPGFLESSDAPLLSIAGAVAVCRAARRLGATGALLKWPNDLVIAGRKAGGVLAEAASAGGALSAVVLGIGLNLNHQAEDFPPDLRPAATSLRLATGRTIAKEQAEAALLQELNSVYLDFLTAGPEGLIAAYRGLLSTLGQSVRVSGPAGTTTGRALDVEASTGALIVEQADGRRKICTAGEVSLRPT